MIVYKVTTELKTTWWMKAFRFCRIKGKRIEFEMYLTYPYYNIGDTMKEGKIIGKEHIDGLFVNELGYC